MSKVINMVGAAPSENTIEGMTATPADVVNGKLFIGSTGSAETGSMPVITAGTTTLTTSSTSYTIPAGKHSGSGKVSISTQTKTATPSASSQTIRPDTNKVLSAVTVNAVPTQTKTVTPGSEAITVTPDSGKFLSSVLVNAVTASTPTDTYISTQEIYSGTVSLGTNDGTLFMDIDVGTEIKESAIFLMYKSSETACGDIVILRLTKEIQFNYGTDTLYYASYYPPFDPNSLDYIPNDAISNMVVYNGTEVIVESMNYFVEGSIGYEEYTWWLIQ